MPMFNADSPLLVAATEAPAVPEVELLQRRLRLLLGNASPKLLRHFFRLQDPAHGGYVGACTVCRAPAVVDPGTRIFLRPVTPRCTCRFPLLLHGVGASRS